MPLSVPYRSISLDSIANLATYHIGQSKTLRGNQSHRLLTLILGRWFMSSPYDIFKGRNPFHARTQASHKALGATLKLGREWVCELTDRLVDAKYIETSAPRLPNGQQEVTTYRPGKKLKKLLVALRASKQHSRVADPQQKIPTEEERVKNKTLLAGLIAEVGEKLAMKRQ